MISRRKLLANCFKCFDDGVRGTVALTECSAQIDGDDSSDHLDPMFGYCSVHRVSAARTNAENTDPVFPHIGQGGEVINGAADVFDTRCRVF